MSKHKLQKTLRFLKVYEFLFPKWSANEQKKAVRKYNAHRSKATNMPKETNG